MMRQREKEEQAVILDFLPNGYPFDKRPLHQKSPVAQAIGREQFTLLELVPKKGKFLQPHEEVYIGDQEREKVHHIMGKIPLSKLTQTAQMELEIVVKDLILKNESKFIEFFNKAGPINTRIHQLELLPGVGKRHTKEIVEAREDKEFESFEDIKNRVKLLPKPEQIIVRRIYSEFNNEDKHRLFVQT
jgi:putative nucleotide binding protein